MSAHLKKFFLMRYSTTKENFTADIPSELIENCCFLSQKVTKMNSSYLYIFKHPRIKKSQNFLCLVVLNFTKVYHFHSIIQSFEPSGEFY